MVFLRRVQWLYDEKRLLAPRVAIKAAEGAVWHARGRAAVDAQVRERVGPSTRTLNRLRRLGRVCKIHSTANHWRATLLCMHTQNLNPSNDELTLKSGMSPPLPPHSDPHPEVQLFCSVLYITSGAKMSLLPTDVKARQ